MGLKKQTLHLQVLCYFCVWCGADDHWVLQHPNVCFYADHDSASAKFVSNVEGTVDAVRLVHKNGKLLCTTGPADQWGTFWYVILHNIKFSAFAFTVCTVRPVCNVCFVVYTKVHTYPRILAFLKATCTYVPEYACVFESHVYLQTRT